MDPQILEVLQTLAELLKGKPGEQTATSVSADIRGRSLQTGRPIGIGWSEEAQALPISWTPIGNQILLIGASLLDTSSTTVCTAIDPWTDVHVYVSNVDGSTTRTYKVGHVASGDSLADVATISGVACNLYVGRPPHHYWGLNLAVGDSIRGLCSSSNKVLCRVYGTPVRI